jgi:hypothetical protein
MKRLALTILVIVASLSGLLVLAASTLPRATEPVAASANPVPQPQPAQPAAFEIRLESQYGPTALSDPNVKFSGGCWANGAFASVAGATPKTYSYTAESIACTYQKQGANTWPLKVTVTRDGAPVQQVVTDSEYGVISFVV